MFLLRPHLVRLLVQLLNLDFFGADVALKLLDLVVQNEFELLQLLNLLLQLANLDVLLLNGGDAGTVLLLARHDVGLDLELLFHLAVKLALLFLQLVTLVLSLDILGRELIHLAGKIGFGAEAIFDFQCEHLAVLVVNLVVVFPGLLFSLFTLVDDLQLLALLLLAQFGHSLTCLLQILIVLICHIVDQLFLLHLELLQGLLKLFGGGLLLLQQRLELLLVGLLFALVLATHLLELLGMQVFHLLALLDVVAQHLILVALLLVQLGVQLLLLVLEIARQLVNLALFLVPYGLDAVR